MTHTLLTPQAFGNRSGRGLIAWTVAGGGLLAASLAMAQQPPAQLEAESAVQTAANGDIGWIESSRTATRAGATALVRTIDGWFGDAPFEASGGRASGYLRLGGLWTQHDGTNAHVRFRLHARLPNLQGKAYVFVGRDNQREEVQDQPDGFTSEQLLQRENRNQDHSFFAGMGYALREGVDLRLGVHGGWKVYAQARYRTQWSLSPRDTVYFRESVFWSIHDHLGSTTALDYEHQINSSLLLRWANVGTITQRNRNFDWQSSFGVHKSYPGLRNAALELIVEGRSRETDISDYGLRASWSQPVYKDWLIGKITVGHFWPKDDGGQRSRSWALGLSVDMHF